MKTLAVMLAILLAIDQALFHGVYGAEIWRSAHGVIQSIRIFADAHTQLMPGA